MLHSSCGVHQGDHDGPVIFALALSDVLRQVRRSFNDDVLDLWYADDEVLIGPQASVESAFLLLQAQLQSIGLNVNFNKCALWHQADDIFKNIVIPHFNIKKSPTPLVVLGFPIAGCYESLTSFAEDAVSRANEALLLLHILQHAQGEALILRQCGPTSKLRHLFRFKLESQILDQLLRADQTTLAHIERIVARPMPEGWHLRASTPITSGGLGFELLANVDVRASYSSALDSIERTLVGLRGFCRMICLDSSLQLNLMSFVRSQPLPDEHNPKQLIQPVGDPSLRLLDASSCSAHASDFHIAVLGPGTTLSNMEFRDAVWMRMGLSAGHGHENCTPSREVDHLGLHRLGCRNAAGARTNRHDELVAVVASTALTADRRSFRVAREERLPETGDSLSRLDDVALDLGSGRCLVDVTVASPFGAAGQRFSRNPGNPAAAASMAYDRKMAKWNALLQTHSLDLEELSSSFQPLAVTLLGVWEEGSLTWLKKFSDVCAAVSGSDKGSYFAGLMTRLSIALWRGNSRLIRALHLPAPSTTDTISYDED